MSAFWTERALWIGTILVIVLVAVLSRDSAPPPGTASPRPSANVIALPRTVAAIESLAAAVVAANPFRLDRRPAAISFADALAGVSDAESSPTAERPPLPEIVVRGVVGGPPWQALLEGVPGRDGSVVARAGDTFGDLAIRTIRRDSVSLQHRDTTWSVAVAVPWK